MNGKKVALKLAEKKSARENRAISVHYSNQYYVTPTSKVGKNVEDYEHVKTFEPDDTSNDTYTRKRIEEYDSLESGDRVILKGEGMQTVTKVTSRQIVTNLGDKFRKSDGVEWGGGEKQITQKIIKND